MYYTKVDLVVFSSKSQYYYTNISIYLYVRNTFLNLKVVIIFCISFFSKEGHGQLGFCQGNSGDPIFTDTFGAGIQDISLPAGTTTYTYANGQNPNDGLYTVSSNSNYFDWFDAEDHTPNDTNGRMLIVNSSFNAGEFYRTTIAGLCENTTYEFSSWLLNLSPSNGFCGAGLIPVNVKFEIWDSTDTNLLASGTTGNIFGTTAPDWNQYALVFQSTPGQTSVILKMINNGVGGCGNDLAIDDIVFKSCGDAIDVNDQNNSNSITLCSTQVPYSDTLTAIPDNVVFSNHFYQWQMSTDDINWLDITGETNATISISGVTTTTSYRAKVAEFASNLNNSDCITFSDVYQIIVNQAPAFPTIECWESATFDDASCSWIITGTQPEVPTNLECWEIPTFNNTTCLWEISGSQPVQPSIECWEVAVFNNTTCSWDVTGTQPMQPSIECWEVATFNNITCSWDVTGTQPEAPTNLECWETTEFNENSCEWDILGTQPIEYIDESIRFCRNEEIPLIVATSIVNPSYQWDSGQVSQSILVDNAGTYVVEVTDGCLTEVITFNVTEIEDPVIETVNSNGSSIIITLLNEGDYSYALDGINYQNSNVFSNILSGVYTISVKSNECDTIVTQAYFHFFIQKYMTPNNDGKNDYFSLNVAQFFSSSELSIFDRYGKLLFSAKNRNVNWDGTFNGTEMPTSDYWYRIVLDGKVFIGHFALKR
ncbi:hypothetical protein FBALC1_16162 [Flavobacteriales bacterium ALC-1]|nr:hypothetical protein FBALC1_16162 [Flavobacteriales bacterium ALC-1]